MRKIYYDKTKNAIIEDISGKKTLGQIKEEFGEADYDILEIDETKEGYHIENGKLKKFNLEEQKQEAEARIEAEKEARRQNLKSKLNLTDEQLDALMEAITKGI